MFLTKVGSGPILQSVEDSVIDMTTGEPLPAHVTDVHHKRVTIGAQSNSLAVLSATDPL